MSEHSAAKSLEKLLTNAICLLIGWKYQRLAECTDSDWDEFCDLHQKLSPAVRSIIQLDNSLQDAEIALKFLRVRKPTSKPSLSPFLRFTWQAFQHHVYIYTNKVGLIKKQFDNLSQLNGNFAEGNSIEIFRKEAKQTFEEVHKERGRTTHVWTVDQESIGLLSMIEIINSAQTNPENASGIYDLKGHSQDTIFTLKTEVGTWLKTMKVFNERLIVHAVNVLNPEILKFNSKFSPIIKRANEPPDSL